MHFSFPQDHDHKLFRQSIWLTYGSFHDGSEENSLYIWEPIKRKIEHVCCLSWPDFQGVSFQKSEENSRLKDLSSVIQTVSERIPQCLISSIFLVYLDVTSKIRTYKLIRKVLLSVLEVYSKSAFC